MAFIETKTARFQYELSGRSDAPVLVFSNSLGTDLRMWAAQAEYFKQSFNVLRYNARGQMGSSLTAGPYSIELLAQDVVDLLDGLRIPKASFCGLSMGGMVGMMLGQRFPQRLHKIVLANTSPKIGTLESWNARIEAVNANGMKAVADAILERWFTPGFRSGEALNSRRPEKCCWTPRQAGTSPVAQRYATWTSARQSRQSGYRRW